MTTDPEQNLSTPNNNNTNNNSISNEKVEQQEEEEWNTEAPTVVPLQLLAAPNIGEYGGGSALKLGCPILVMRMPVNRIPAHLLKKLPSAINECISANNELNVNERIARLPTKLFTELNWNQTTAHFVIHTHVPLSTGDSFNLMYQALLFEEVVKDPERIGCSLNPLIGIFDTFGMSDPSSKMNVHQFAGYENLRWSDQHCHLDCGEWHLGSDMSRIVIQSQANLCKFFSICCDLENMRLDISLIFIIHPGHISSVEGILRNFNPHQSQAKLKEFFQFFCIQFEDEFANASKNKTDEKFVLEQFLFGVSKSK